MKRAPKPATAQTKGSSSPAPRRATKPQKSVPPKGKRVRPSAKAEATSARPKGKLAKAISKAKTQVPSKLTGARAGQTRASKQKPAGATADCGAIAERLALAVPDAVCELRFATPFELLIATILAAQSTDKMINAVMPSLLARYPTAEALAVAAQEDVEQLVKSTGFFRNKAKAIRGAAQHLVTHHAGEVPRSIAELTAVPGVARKTANVVLGTAYRIGEGFIVDTHVTRVSQRLGLTRETDPVRIERDLCDAFPPSDWIDLGHRMVLHGRYTCVAKKPECEACPLNELCPSRLTVAEASLDTRIEREAAKVSAALSQR